MTTDIRPYAIDIPQAEIDELRERLGRTRWPDAIRGAGWRYGADLASMQALAAYWAQDFDWRERERDLNRHPQFLARIDGHDLHFIHRRARRPSAPALLMLHGWPGSFVELLDVAAMLADPAAHGAPAGVGLDVIVPSIPGYGFSSLPRDPGMSDRAVARLMALLMRQLGYAQFIVQGGDWGASIACWLGSDHAPALRGMHLNYIPESLEPALGPGTVPLTPAEAQARAAAQRWYAVNGAYSTLQATTPQTLAYALNDSPVGLAAWIVEKFRDWSDCSGNVERLFTRDGLLTHLSIYWYTRTIHASMRLYFESRREPMRLAPGQRIAVPTAVIRFAKEAPFFPRAWAERCFDLRRWTEVARGGHFAALEMPDALVADVRAFVQSLAPKMPWPGAA